jgi:DNA-binding transcriptional LysR family regulator
MTFQQLTYVVEIARCGSINKAAHKLLLSQSGISTALRELEQELGIRFFLRSNRGVECTPEGREFLSYAVSLLEQKKRIESLYGNPGAAAPTRFSVSSQRFPFTEDAFLRLLHSGDPSSRFSLKEDSMETVISDVFEHNSDIGVISLTELTEKIICRMLDSRDLEFHEIAAVDPCVYVRAGHPILSLPTVTAEDLAPYPYVSFEQAQGVASDFSEEYQMLSMKRSEQSIRVNSRSVMMSVLEQTDGFTTGSGLLSPGCSPDGVVSIPLAGKPVIRLGYILPQGSKISPETERFIRLLTAAVTDAIHHTQTIHTHIVAVRADEQ